MRRILSRATELTQFQAAPPNGRGLTPATTYGQPPLTSWQLSAARTADRRSSRDVLEFVGLILLAIVLGTMAAGLTAVVLRAWIGA
jgi:hypothetical protein